MAGKVKFDRDATFKQIIGADREPEAESQETPAAKEKKTGSGAAVVLSGS
jgi:hypothetical protein